MHIDFPAITRARAAFVPGPNVELLDGNGARQVLVLAADADRVRGHVRTFLDEVGETGLEPITNRRTFGVLEMLRSGNPLRTGSIRTGEEVETRLGLRELGDHDTIINYALLYPPSPALDAASGALLLNGGPDGYGQVALVLHPERVLARSTFTNGDSGGTTGLYPPEAIGDAITGALIRRAGGFERDAAHNELGAQGNALYLESILRDTTGEEVRRMLTTIPANSDFSRGVPPMPEVQVFGGIRPRDVREIRVQDGTPPAALRALREAAEPHGIAVRDELPLDKEAKVRWKAEAADPAGLDIDRDWDTISSTWVERSSSPTSMF